MTYPTMAELTQRAIENLANSIVFNYRAMGEEWAMSQAKSSSTLGWKAWNNALLLAECEMIGVSLAKYYRTSN